MAKKTSKLCVETGLDFSIEMEGSCTGPDYLAEAGAETARTVKLYLPAGVELCDYRLVVRQGA